MSDRVKHRFGLRVLSRGGGCDSWIEVRAYTAIGACKRALLKAAERHPEFGEPEEWTVTYLLLMSGPGSAEIAKRNRSSSRVRSRERVK